MNKHRNSARLAAAMALSLGAALAPIGASLATTANDLSAEVGDARREAQIWTSYALSPHLRGFDISVDVSGNRAVLTGKVQDQIEKELAEQIALGVDGIARVDNQLTVDGNAQRVARKPNERDFGATMSDASITASVKSKLLWSEATDGLKINVDTRDGRVTLAGTADTVDGKNAATRLARNTDGVLSVDNRIQVDPNYKRGTDLAEQEVSDAWLTTRVKSSLLTSRGVDGLDIAVETKNGVVYLSGEVDSSAERALAVELADNIRGVKKVDASGLKQI